MKFEITVEQANLILQGLAQLPYHISVNLIAELQKQAQPQIAAMEQPTKAE